LFRDYESKYLLASVAIALCVVSWTAWYEVVLADRDSLPETITAIGQGISAAVAVAILSLATWEIVMVLARRMVERMREERNKKIQAWEDWDERRRQARMKGEEFTEPSPAEKEANSTN
jgi:hypothetical protein